VSRDPIVTDDLLPVAILAGGLGKRLGRLTGRLPKALVDVNGEPFIAHQLTLLRANGARRVVLCVGFQGGAIQDVIGDGSAYGVDLTYSWDGPNLLGTAGALKKALPLLGESFLVVYGDSYLRCDYRHVQSVFERSQTLALMTVFRNDGLWDQSNVEFSGGAIVAYDKASANPRMRHIDYGLGAFHMAAFDEVPDNESFDLATLYQSLLGGGQLAAVEVEERFYEIGSPAGLDETRAYLAARRLGSATRLHSASQKTNSADG
jgi:NDP-sugar pyrophosphorylase family protein